MFERHIIIGDDAHAPIPHPCDCDPREIAVKHITVCKCRRDIFAVHHTSGIAGQIILPLAIPRPPENDFAVVDADKAVGVCDLFYGLMAFPTMFAILRLSPKVKRATKEYFSSNKKS